MLRERDYFGEMSILDGEPRSATAVAKADSLLLEIRQEEFHGILARHFEAALGIIKTLSERIRRVERESAAKDGGRLVS
jgi:CRP/FNR family transcriptional regulator/CRP/FNR family cyclic AMP-dependent transcriptional regulator